MELEDALLDAKLLTMACPREVGHEQGAPLPQHLLSALRGGQGRGSGREAMRRFLLELAGMRALDGGQRATLGIVLTLPRA